MENDIIKPSKAEKNYPFAFCVYGKPRLTEDMEWEYDEAVYVKAFGKDHFEAQEKVVEYAKEQYGEHYVNSVEQWEVLFPVNVPENVYMVTLK